MAGSLGGLTMPLGPARLIEAEPLSRDWPLVQTRLTLPEPVIPAEARVQAWPPVRIGLAAPAMLLT
jgi:hypothetical protein